MKYTAHMQSSQHADVQCSIEFEVSPDEVEGLDGDALETFLSNRAVDELCESGLISIWFEKA